MKAVLFLVSVALYFSAYSQVDELVDSTITDYKKRIELNGGSINTNDELALKTFITSAVNHQYWSKIIEIGSLTGNELNAALVKLKFPAITTGTIKNQSFSSSDYSADKGLRLSSLKSLNTELNLNTLDLKGLFGFSLWLSDHGSAWIGSSNSGTPYSILNVSDTSINALMGFPPIFASTGGRISSSSSTFYHIIKQSLGSMQAFVDGIKIGNANTTMTTDQLRNDNVEVFQGASDIGYGLFYAIDNGMLTDEDVKNFYADVQQLEYDLGRRIAAPLISSNGQYSETQYITINQALTNSSMSGATIYYTKDGSTPTTASAIYSSPLEISTTTRIRAIAVKGNSISEESDAWVAIVPNGFNTKKYYTAHVMINLLAFTSNMEEWVRQMKTAGYNLIWAHLDDYKETYPATLKALMDAAASIGDIQVMPGPSWWVEPALVSQMFADTWSHPALFKIDGKKIYTGWDYQPTNQHTIDSLLMTKNITKDQYYLWAYSRYPYSYDEGNTWVTEYSSNGILYWNGTSSVYAPIQLSHLYDNRPQIDGLINFAVDQGPNNKNIITTNRLITQSSKQRGKFSMAGMSAFYASVSYSDFGFKGAAEIWDSILALPSTNRPTAMSDITANDYAELSYISPMVNPPTNGILYVPQLGSGFTLANNVRYPLTDHSGVQKFLRPWVDAFLNNQSTPVFAEDRMFAWYWLHPGDQSTTPVLPSLFNGYSNLNQTWWNTMLYSTGKIEVGGLNQVDGIKYFFADGMNKIRMAAHLLAPARLKINDSISELKPAGAAYYEINVDNYRGTPTFSILRGENIIKHGYGLQPIVNNVFPGGWNYLSTEVLEDNLLPVTISSLKAYPKESGINIDWTVQNETGLRGYELEKSTNGQQFMRIGAIQAIENNQPLKLYTWFDPNPVLKDNYYRIKIIDQNGNWQYSDIVVLNLSNVKELITVYPNPITSNQFVIKCSNIPAGQYNVRFLNSSGQCLYTNILNHTGGFTSQTISLSGLLPRGKYDLQITGNGRTFTKHLLK